ncbi:unnamed protein product [Mytilus coruscus]|uniref:Ig-like domain-containing protein n=1 Tax=Mytilus coruscus TaxID=42192 RepID=A0A6J8EAL9_MYTCO|nr:unnamed protein product [Mytilus coruscus]
METDIFGRLRKWKILLFTSGKKDNPSLPHKNKLKIFYSKETGAILQIRNFSQSDEGLYICHSSSPNGIISSVRFVLREKSQEVNFINAFPGTSIILRYNYTAITVDWTSPNHDNNGIISEETDMHSIKRKWNVTRYTNNGHFNPNLPHKKRLKIVGDAMRGQLYLQIENVSNYDAGLYRCNILSENSCIFVKSFIIQIKQVPELTITYEPFLPINEGKWFKMCYYSNGTMPNQTLGWLYERQGMQGRHLSNMTCFYFENIHRNDSGVCTYIAE